MCQKLVFSLVKVTPSLLTRLWSSLGNPSLRSQWRSRTAPQSTPKGLWCHPLQGISQDTDSCMGTRLVSCPRMHWKSVASDELPGRLERVMPLDYTSIKRRTEINVQCLRKPITQQNIKGRVLHYGLLTDNVKQIFILGLIVTWQMRFIYKDHFNSAHWNTYLSFTGTMDYTWHWNSWNHH